MTALNKIISGRVFLGWTSTTKQGLMCLAQEHNAVTVQSYCRTEVKVSYPKMAWDGTWHSITPRWIHTPNLGFIWVTPDSGHPENMNSIICLPKMWALKYAKLPSMQRVNELDLHNQWKIKTKTSWWPLHAGTIIILCYTGLQKII